MNEPTQSPARPHYPALDGLRAIAVLLVMATHLRYRPFALGWMGVPMFFALSGFLITGILLRARSSADYFRSFYKRRALRIFPIYYLFIVFTWVVGTWLAMPTQDLWRSAVYIQNYRIPGEIERIPDFFGGHTWSLAVEEQFYLIWPLVVWLVSPRWLLRCCVVLAIGALAFRWMAFSRSEDPALWILYGWLPSNLDCLACGSIVAILHHLGRLRERPLLVAMLVGFAGLAWLVLRLPWDAWQTSLIWLHVEANVLLNTMLGIGCAAAVGYFALRPAWPLTTSPLKRIGRISYGLYLYHVPIYWFVDRTLYTSVPHYGRAAIKVALTFVVAEASWRLIERRLLTPRDLPAPRADAAAPRIAAGDR